MQQNVNPYAAPDDVAASDDSGAQHRGPLLYFAWAMIVGAAVAMPLIVPRSLAVKDDPNPIGYLLLLLSFPIGGLVYRIRSRKWPIDDQVRTRQLKACLATQVLPMAVALLTGMRGQGLQMTVLSGIISLTLISGIFIAGQRRT